jgi:cytochrome c oxidase subunit 4
MNAAHHVSVRSYVVVWAILLLLLAVTVGAAYVRLGVLNVPVALAIATTKAVLVMLYFMHIRYNRWLIWLFAALGFIFVAHMIVWIVADYVSRGWLSPVGM